MMALLLTGVLSLNVATPGAVRAAVVAAPRAIQPTMLLSPLKAALFLNAAVETANGVIYLVKPLRNNMIKAAFGISAPDEQSALAGAFQTIGGLHAAAAFQCITALLVGAPPRRRWSRLSHCGPSRQPSSSHAPSLRGPPAH